MIKEAIDKILSLAPIQTLEVNADTYTVNRMHRLIEPQEVAPETLELHTLVGLLEYVKTMFTEKDCQEMERIPALHIQGPRHVELIGTLQPTNDNKRFTYARAGLFSKEFPFGQWMRRDKFIIELMTNFVQTPETKRLLSNIASITAISSKEDIDDGITQVVEIKKGLRLKGEVRIENPIRLKPWRTFREVDQPESEFVIRLDQSKQHQGPESVEVSLHEADGAAWQLEAIGNIKEYLDVAMHGWAEEFRPHIIS